MLNSEIKDPTHIYYNPLAYEAVHQTLNTSYFTTDGPTSSYSLNFQNLLKHLYIQYAYHDLCDTNNKKTVSKLKNFLKQKDSVIPRSKSKHVESELVKENKKLTDMISILQENEDDEEDELGRELENKKKQLKALNATNKTSLNKLRNKVHFELKNKNLLFYVNSSEDQTYYDLKETRHRHQQLGVGLNSIDRVDLQIDYLRGLILKLDRKQVAESICKIVEVDRSRNDYKYVVHFQEALNMKDYNFTEQEIIGLNDLRQYSLIKFYNVSLKSMYSNISHNFAGFGHIYKRRNQENQLKDKNLFEIMKRIGHQSNDVMNAMENFEMCHHCKQLFNINYLIKCEYRSSKMGVPITTPSYSDPYLLQILQNDSTSNSNRSFLNRKKNSYMTYTKKGNEFVCYRKYCKTCIKQNYDSLEKNGLCAFCQGICFCTRCLRNDMIIKLKTMFSLFGGDINDLHHTSLFEKLVARTAVNEKDQIFSGMRKGERKKGRPKKAIVQPKSTVKTYTKMKQLRDHMNQCRMICHLVKRREKQKLFLMEEKQRLFEKKIEILDEDKKLLSKLFSENESSGNDDKNNIARTKQIRKMR